MKRPALDGQWSVAEIKANPYGALIYLNALTLYVEWLELEHRELFQQLEATMQKERR